VGQTSRQVGRRSRSRYRRSGPCRWAWIRRRTRVPPAAQRSNADQDVIW